MKRRTLDLMFSSGGMVLAVLLLILGFVLLSNANFAHSYVKDQLSQEQLTFKTADKLTPAEVAWTKARSNCLVTYAGQHVTTGKQAECWANEYVGGHLKDPAKIANANGMSYADLGVVQTTLRQQIAAAQTARDPGLAALQTKLADVTTARNTVFQGEMIRNALLTSFGFSVLGEKARLGATVLFIVAGLMCLLSCAGFLHAYRTPATKPFAAVAPAERTPVGV
jgi:hypothetical protein